MNNTVWLGALAIAIAGMGGVSCSSGGDGSTTSSHDGGSGGGGSPSAPIAGIPGCAATFLDEQGVCRPTIGHCAGGSIPKFDEGCVPVGIPSCAAVFLESDGACRVSASKCQAGEIPILSQGCVPIDGPEGCGAAPWGPIADDPHNLYVDPSYAGGAGDGTKEAPFVTIASALAAAKSGSRVVLAAGTYAEPIELDKSVEIVGRCASKVSITGTIAGSTPVAVRVAPGVTASAVRRVHVTAAGLGVLAKGSVTLDSVWLEGTTGGVFASGSGAEVIADHLLVQDMAPLPDLTAGDGIGAYQGSRLTLTASAVLRARTQGIGIAGAQSATIADTLIEATQPRASDGIYGYGITAQSAVTVQRTAIVGNRGAAVDVVGGEASATIEDSVIERTVPMSASSWTGSALVLQGGATATLSRCQLRESIGAAVRVFEASDLTLTRTLVHGTGAAPNHEDNGLGIGILDGSKVTLEDSAVVANTTAGIGLLDAGSSVHARGTLFEGTVAGGAWGVGVALEADTQGTFERVAIVGNRGAGFVAFAGASATLTDSLVASTLPGTDGANGVGVLASQHEALSIKSSQILGNAVAGVLVQGGPATIEGSIIRDVVAGRVALPIGASADGVGDGLLVVTAMGAGSADVRGCEITGAERAGVLFAGAGGSLRGTTVRGNRYGLVLQGGAAPEVADDNWIEGNTESDRLDAGTLPTP